MSAANASRIAVKGAGRGAALRPRVKQASWGQSAPPHSGTTRTVTPTVTHIATPTPVTIAGTTPTRGRTSGPSAGTGRGGDLRPGQASSLLFQQVSAGGGAGRGRVPSGEKNRPGVGGMRGTLDALSQHVDSQGHRNNHATQVSPPRRQTAQAGASRSMLSADVLDQRRRGPPRDRSRERSRRSFGGPRPDGGDMDEDEGYDTASGKPKRTGRNSRNASIYGEGDSSARHGGGNRTQGGSMVPRALDLLAGSGGGDPAPPATALARLADRLRRQRMTQRLKPVDAYDAIELPPENAAGHRLPPTASDIHGAIVVDGTLLAGREAPPFAWGDFSAAGTHLPDGHWAQDYVNGVVNAVQFNHGLVSGGQRRELLTVALKTLAEVSRQQVRDDEGVNDVDRFADAEEDVQAEATM